MCFTLLYLWNILRNSRLLYANIRSFRIKWNRYTLLNKRCPKDSIITLRLRDIFFNNLSFKTIACCIWKNDSFEIYWIFGLNICCWGNSGRTRLHKQKNIFQIFRSFVAINFRFSHLLSNFGNCKSWQRYRCLTWCFIPVSLNQWFSFLNLRKVGSLFWWSRNCSFFRSNPTITRFWSSPRSQYLSEQFWNLFPKTSLNWYRSTATLHVE